MRDVQRYAIVGAGLLAIGMLAACNGGSTAVPPDGPVSMGVVAGNNQTVGVGPALSNKLPQQVVAQVVRLPNGQVAMTTRLLDLALPPKASAQTVVNGIPGAVVCGVAPDPKHALTPEVPCTNTDALGKAYFTFHADTVAGIAKAQVRGTVNGVTQVSDSVQATVQPGVVVDFGMPNTVGNVHVGDTINVRAITAGAVDRYGNRLTNYTVAYLRHNAVCHSALVNGSCPAPGYDFSGSDTDFIVGDKMVVRTGDMTFDLSVDGLVKQGSQLQYAP